MTAKKGLMYALLAYVIFVFIQSLFFKFTGSDETNIIFSTIAAWMDGIGLGLIAPAFESIGGYAIGVTELIAAFLLIREGTRRLGALLGLCVISGAIFFHLFTPLGIYRFIDISCQTRDAVPACPTDGGILFFMACGVWVACALILWLTRSE